MAEKEGVSERLLEGVSDEEMAVAYSGPALATNKFYVSITSGGVRIAFAEVNPQVRLPAFRTAVMLPFPDALTLAELVNRLVHENVQIVMEGPVPDGAQSGSADDGAKE